MMNETIDVSKPFELETANPAETALIGAMFATQLQPPAVIALIGDLGSGKTEFVKGFMKESGGDDVVSSPTFAILNTYKGRGVTVYHFDLYRIEHDSELTELGFEEYLFGDGICLIEWAERAEEWLPSDTTRIHFEHAGGSRRCIRRDS